MYDSYDYLEQIAEARKSCRRFSDEPVSDEDILRILKIASRSPFASGRKNWKILVIQEKDKIEALARIIQEASGKLTSSMEEDAAALVRKYARNFTFFKEAPILMIPYCRNTSTMQAMLREQLTEEIAVWERDNLTKSLSCVSMMILLAAESLGLGSCCMTGPLLAAEEIATFTGIPSGSILGAIIPVGHKLHAHED